MAGYFWVTTAGDPVPVMHAIREAQDGFARTACGWRIVSPQRQHPDAFARCQSCDATVARDAAVSDVRPAGG